MAELVTDSHLLALGQLPGFRLSTPPMDSVVPLLVAVLHSHGLPVSCRSLLELNSPVVAPMLDLVELATLLLLELLVFLLFGQVAAYCSAILLGFRQLRFAFHSCLHEGLHCCWRFLRLQACCCCLVDLLLDLAKQAGLVDYY